MDNTNISELEKFDEETQSLMKNLMEDANVFKLDSLDDFYKVVIKLVDSFIDNKIPFDDFAFLSGKLLEILEENEELVTTSEGCNLSDHLLMIDDLTWNIRNNPDKAAKVLNGVFDFVKNLKEKSTPE